MTDWRSYDSIAADYDRGWGARFRAVAHFLLDCLDPGPDTRVLDAGTGTGAVARSLAERFPDVEVVGVDLSAKSLELARRFASGCRVARADVRALPFPADTFEMATLSFVLSHLPEPSSGLTELGRVLVPRGRVAVSSWGPAVHPVEQAWRATLGEALGADALEEAGRVVAPGEERFADPEALRAALLEASFGGVALWSREFFVRAPVEDFVADRELSSSGRLTRERLGEEGWARFRERAIGRLVDAFGPEVDFGRPVHVAVGAASGEGAPAAAP